MRHRYESNADVIPATRTGSAVLGPASDHGFSVKENPHAVDGFGGRAVFKWFKVLRLCAIQLVTGRVSVRDS